ncbi:hypothetical protein EJB05_02778, partial [Eragrostis curvula]
MAGGHHTGSVGSVASAGRGGEGRSTVGAAAAGSFATWWRRGIRKRRCDGQLEFGDRNWKRAIVYEKKRGMIHRFGSKGL